MEENKKKTNWWLIIFIILLIVFGSLYFMNLIGYYDANRNRMLLTEEKRKQFEHDVSIGKDVRLEDYFENQKKDYGNSFSNLSLKISNSIDVLINKGLKQTFKALGKLFK